MPNTCQQSHLKKDECVEDQRVGPNVPLNLFLLKLKIGMLY